MTVIDCSDPATNLSNFYQKFQSGSPAVLTSFNTSIQIECLVGYRLIDGTGIYSISCSNAGAWFTMQPCYSMNSIINLFIDSFLQN